MRVLVVGAGGAIGRRLVPQLISAGHEVTGTYRSAASARRISGAGAAAVPLDVLDPPAVREAVRAARPDAIINEATALANLRFGRNMDRVFAVTSRIRSEGTDALLAAAREAGVRRFVAQSFASYRYARTGGMVKTEDDPLDTAPARTARVAFAAMSHLDEAVTAAGGIALRYGGFYGDPDGDGLLDAIRKRQFPLVGSAGGYTSFIQLDDAAAATVLALEHGTPGVYNITDDEPAPMSEWLPALAAALGAAPPRRVPGWLAGLVAGQWAVMMATQARGASNARARRELGWTPRYPTWREGFPAVYGGARRSRASA